jgi:hypothetical protein
MGSRGVVVIQVKKRRVHLLSVRNAQRALLQRMQLPAELEDELPIDTCCSELTINQDLLFFRLNCAPGKFCLR